MAKEGRRKFNPRPGRGLNPGPPGWQSCCSRDNFLCPWKLLSVVPTHLFFSQSYSAAAKLMMITCLITGVNNFVLVYSSTQRNIVLLCKLRIPESKLLALFKPLQITFFHENSHFVVFQSFKTSCSKNNSGER